MNSSAPMPDIPSPLPTTDRLLPAGVGIAIAAPLTILLDIPPLIWHIQNRNTAAASLVAWTILCNLFSFTNLLIWPTDDFADRYVGQSLCDVQVKFMVARAVAFPAATLCIVRALADVMDTNKPRSLPTKAQRTRMVVMDLVWCLGLPLVMMLFHFIVQPNRYFLAGVSGCTPSFWGGWVSILLVCLPPLLLSLANAYYAGLVMYRLKRYGSAFKNILASSNTTKSRFLRLYVISCILTVGLIPVEIYVLYSNLPKDKSSSSFNWNVVHNPKTFDYIVLFHSAVFYDRWVNIIIGFVLFLIFGMGKDAQRMYRKWLRVLGLGKCFPVLYKESATNTRSGSQMSSNSKAKLMSKSKLTSSSTNDSTFHSDKDLLDAISPTKSLFSNTKTRPQQNQRLDPFSQHDLPQQPEPHRPSPLLTRLTKSITHLSPSRSTSPRRNLDNETATETAPIKLQDRTESTLHPQAQTYLHPPTSTGGTVSSGAWSDHGSQNGSAGASGSGSGSWGRSQEVLAQKRLIPDTEVLVRKEVRRGSESV